MGMAIDAKTTLTTALAVAALALPASAHAADPAISDQPTDATRVQLTQMRWIGESASQSVSVEYRHGLEWMTITRDGADDLVLTDEGDGRWSVAWLPSPDSPSGTYRIRVEGDGYTLVSDEFDVAPCDCLVANPLHVHFRKGAFRVRLTAEYLLGAAAGFPREPLAVDTGRPVVRVLRNGRRIGSVRLRYTRGAFRGVWRGRRGPRHSVVFALVSMTDAFGNR
jgi:hypothetical protein